MLPQPTKVFHIQPMTAEPMVNRMLPALQSGLRTAVELVSLVTFLSALSVVYLMIH